MNHQKLPTDYIVADSKNISYYQSAQISVSCTGNVSQKVNYWNVTSSLDNGFATKMTRDLRGKPLIVDETDFENENNKIDAPGIIFFAILDTYSTALGGFFKSVNITFIYLGDCILHWICSSYWKPD